MKKALLKELLQPKEIEEVVEEKPAKRGRRKKEEIIWVIVYMMY